MSVEKQSYATMPNGTEVDEYTMTNSHGLKVKMITYGATVTAVEVPDRDGEMANIVLFCDSLRSYQTHGSYFGSTVGRYANRIARGKFTLDDVEYTVDTNDGANHLHGGRNGFDKRVWDAEPVEGDGFVGVKFSLVSPDGDGGYPGELKATVVYTLTDQNELKIDYTATTDKPTVVNLTNHAYWNLAGAGSGDMLKQKLMINADRYLPVDSGLIPTGELKPVEGTPMAFLEPTAIGSRIDQVQGGYDHCYVLNTDEDEEMTLAARVVDPDSGRVLEILTTQPAIQFYSGNFLNGSIRAGGASYGKHAAFCLETQHYPDSPNQPDFPSTVLRPDETYHEVTVHKFSVEE